MLSGKIQRGRHWLESQGTYLILSEGASVSLKDGSAPACKSKVLATPISVCYTNRKSHYIFSEDLP